MLTHCKSYKHVIAIGSFNNPYMALILRAKKASNIGILSWLIIETSFSLIMERAQLFQEDNNSKNIHTSHFSQPNIYGVNNDDIVSTTTQAASLFEDYEDSQHQTKVLYLETKPYTSSPIVHCDCIFLKEMWCLFRQSELFS